jgi:4-amino-4-deoxy-L-arabinose transferase-like glycosyltransferase
MMNADRNLLTKHTLSDWLIPSAFCLILLAQLLFSVQQMSQHADEATHLYAGYRALKCGDYSFGREHPPLAKMLVAIPLLWSKPAVDCTESAVGMDEQDRATRWLYSQDGWWHLLCEARVVASLCSVALCLGVWIAARRMFGRGVAVLSTAIIAFEPNILGHGALLLNNILLSVLFLLTVFTFYLWTRQLSPRYLILTGLFTGMALLTKHSAVLLIPILFLLAVLEAWLERSNTTGVLRRTLRNLGAVAAICVIAAGTIWCGYGMHYTRVAVGSSESPNQQSSGMDPEVRILNAMGAAHLMPKDYLGGLLDVRAMVGGGGAAIHLFGRRYTESPWFFLPLTMVIKFTVALLAMLVLGAVGMIAAGRERRTEIIFMLLPALLYLATSLRVQRTAIGIWHLFPMFPFLIIAAAAGCVALARRSRWVGGVLACLLVLHAASSLRSYPNYLSYANEAWGGPQNLYKHLPWTDLDQTFWQVSRYMEQHPNTPCWLATDWYVPPSKYGVPCTPMGNPWEMNVPGRMKGIVFVSSPWLDIDGQPGGPYSPFYVAKPKTFLGGSAMLVYEGEFDTHVASARAFDNKAMHRLDSGNSARYRWSQRVCSNESSVTLSGENGGGGTGGARHPRERGCAGTDCYTDL